jgi:type I restriction enzyme S subunit
MNISRDGRVELENVKYVEDTKGARIEPGDVLFNNTNSPHLVGKTAYFDRDGEWAFSNHMTRLRPSRVIDGRFLALQLHWLWMRGFYKSILSHHVNQASVATKTLAQVEILVPPIAEQRRIVEAIEEQLSRLHAQTAEIQRTIRRSVQLRRAVLRRIVPEPLPSHWRLSVVDDVGVAGLGRQRAPQFHTGDQMRPYLRVANVLEDRLDLTDVMEMDFPGDQAVRYRLEPGDILLNEGQAPEFVGRPAMFRGEIDDLCFSKTLLRFRAGPGVESEFALLVFLSYLHSGRFRREARITTNIGHMVLARFKRIEFPLPPIAEQREIVDRVRSQLSKLERAQCDLNAALRKTSALRRAILARAFRGELVPPDLDDEPAASMLEQIANKRPVAPKRGRRADDKAPA